MTIIERLTRFVSKVFKTNLETFLEALKLSPNAQGYVSGSISELLLKQKLTQEYGLEVERIREKWEGRKHPKHHGDFYFRNREGDIWYVLESKGVKSNSEKWHKLYNYENLKNFLITYSDKIYWIDTSQDVEKQVVEWIQRRLSKFKNEYAINLYDYEEIRKYQPKRDTPKARAIIALQAYSRDEINQLLEERLRYVLSQVKVLETHFISGTSASSERTQATPRKDEFNLISIDIFLRYPEHKFLFANPHHLDSSGDDPNHLQQNYIMGFVFADEQGAPYLSVADDWYEEFDDVYETLDPEDSIDIAHKQVDNRNVVVDETD